VSEVKEFGLFVDVGAERDGLVHIKDVSRQYSVENIQSKIITGQSVDVWVKFVDTGPADSPDYKLGLQMYPVELRDEVTPLSSFSTGQAVEGVVTKTSAYGVFVDIGTEVDAFLRRRMTQLTKRQRLQPPSITHPVGSLLQTYIYTIDRVRRFATVTTYKPQQWGALNILPPGMEEQGQGQGLEQGLGQGAKEEEKRRQGQRAPSSVAEETGGGGGGSGGGGDGYGRRHREGDGEDGSEEDDDDGSDEEDDEEDGLYVEAGLEFGDEEEVPRDARFRSMAIGIDKSGRQRVLLPAVRRLSSVEGLMQAGLLDETALLQLYARHCVNGPQLGLDEHGLGLFMDGLSALSGEDGDEVRALSGGGWDGDNDGGDGGIDTNLEELYEKRSKTAELLDYVFASVGRGKEAVTLDDVRAWDFAASMMQEGALTLAQLECAFSTLAGPPARGVHKGAQRGAERVFVPARGADPGLSPQAFEAFLDVLNDYQVPLSDDVDVNSDLDEDWDEDEDKDQGQDQVVDMEEAFRELSSLPGSGGRSCEAVSVGAVLDWTLLQELDASGDVCLQDARGLLLGMAGTGSGSDALLDFAAFEKFLDGLVELAAAGSPAGVRGSQRAVDVVVAEATTGRSKEPGPYSRCDDSSSSRDEDEDDTALLHSVWMSLACGKTGPTSKDLLQWDLVLDLMGEGLLTEASLSRMTDAAVRCTAEQSFLSGSAGTLKPTSSLDVSMLAGSAGSSAAIVPAADNNGKGTYGVTEEKSHLSIHALDALVDSLVALYDAVELEAGETGVSATRKAVAQGDDGRGHTGDEEIEIDPQEFFDTHAVDGHVPLVALTNCQWDLARVVFDTGLLTPTHMLDWAYASGATAAGADQAAFDALVGRISDTLDEFFETTDGDGVSDV
jgi:predicted RNA-binding protein with RPS1 domain